MSIKISNMVSPMGKNMIKVDSWAFSEFQSGYPNSGAKSALILSHDSNSVVTLSHAMLRFVPTIGQVCGYVHVYNIY